jgi:NAD(P)-dependent dehydrogenase (short-subunit alcohol dehydrogenase family)
MKDFAGRIAVVTGGGSGMGRELVRQLVAEGCSVAMCDVFQRTMDETRALCEADRIPQGVRITTHLVDVSDEAAVLRFRDEVAAQLQTDRIHLLFNNAGIGGGGSMFTDSRESWDKTFGVCWYGVYYMTRAFLPMLVKADEGHIVNTSSLNGFWASLGPMTPHTAYSAAKFAVKGFTEALITDLRINAPHVRCSVVCPGHIGTNIAINSRLVLAGGEGAEMSAEELAGARRRLKLMGQDETQFTDDMIRAQVAAMGAAFRDNAPMTAAQAARVILDGVREQRWRILVGEDSKRLDELVRADPEKAYELDFFTLFAPVNPAAPARPN